MSLWKSELPPPPFYLITISILPKHNLRHFLLSWFLELYDKNQYWFPQKTVMKNLLPSRFHESVLESTLPIDSPLKPLESVKSGIGIDLSQLKTTFPFWANTKIHFSFIKIFNRVKIWVQTSNETRDFCGKLLFNKVYGFEKSSFEWLHFLKANYLSTK